MNEPIVSKEFIRQHAMQAVEDGKGLSENPFPPETQASISWEHAYWDAIVQSEEVSV